MKRNLYLADGFRLAFRHPLLALAVYLVPLLLVLPIGRMIRSSFGQALDNRPFADQVLSGGAFVVLPEVDRVLGWLGGAVGLALLAALVLHVLLAAGIVEVLLERGRGFLDGVKNLAWRFVRSGFLFALAAIISIAGASGIAALFFKLAESQRDGRLDLVGIGIALFIAFLLLGPLHLAYDLSRLAAAFHDEGAMLRGFGRALVAVVKKPGLFLPLMAIFAAAPITLMLISLAVLPAAPAGLRGVLGLVIVPQLAFMLRALLTVGFWGTEVACYRALGEPRWCQPRPRRVVEDTPVEVAPVEVGLSDAHEEASPVDAPFEGEKPAPEQTQSV